MSIIDFARAIVTAVVVACTGTAHAPTVATPAPAPSPAATDSCCCQTGGALPDGEPGFVLHHGNIPVAMCTKNGGSCIGPAGDPECSQPDRYEIYGPAAP